VPELTPAKTAEEEWDSHWNGTLEMRPGGPRLPGVGIGNQVICRVSSSPRAVGATQTSNNNNNHNKNNNSTLWFTLVSGTLHLLPLSPQNEAVG
jgi:hypothetical protein